MMSLLSPKLLGGLIVACILAVAGLFLYRAGAASVRTEWDASIIQQQSLAASQEEDNRKLEAKRQTNVIEAQNEATKRTQNIQIAYLAVDAERHRLLDSISTHTTDVPSQSAATSDQPATTINDLFRSCTAEVQELGRNADQHASDVRMLLDAWPK